MESDIMADFNSEKYYDHFCKKEKCHECEGTDFNGEPNGYGCPAREKYIEKRYDSILKRRMKKLQEEYNANKSI